MGGKERKNEESAQSRMEGIFLSHLSKEKQPTTIKGFIFTLAIITAFFPSIMYILITTEPVKWQEKLDEFAEGKPEIKEVINRWGKEFIDFFGSFIVKLANTPLLYKQEPKTYDEFITKDKQGKSLLDKCYDFIVNDYEQEERQKEEATTRMIKDIRRKRPNVSLIPNNKLCNSLPVIIKEAEATEKGIVEFPLIVAGKDTPKEITNRTLVDVGKEDGVILPSSYTPFLRSVYNGICTLYNAGYDSFSPAMVYRAMTGSEGSPRKDTLENTRAAIEKLRRIRVSIDVSNEYIKHHIIKKGESVTLGDFLVVARDIEARIGGKDIAGYYISSKPFLLGYSEQVRQVLNVKTEILEIRKVTSKGTPTTKIPDSIERIGIRDALVCRIEAIKNKKNNIGPRIKFSSILDSAMIEGGSHNKVKRHIIYIVDCLSYWKALNHIHDFQLDSADNPTSAIIITKPNGTQHTPMLPAPAQPAE